MTPTAITPREFVRTRSGVEASLMRIGLNTAQVVLIAEDGEWLRFVVDSLGTARELCSRLKIATHDGYPDHLRKRVGSFTRSSRDWAEAAYPERTGGTSV